MCGFIGQLKTPEVSWVRRRLRVLVGSLPRVALGIVLNPCIKALSGVA